jgi:hypothetical protein
MLNSYFYTIMELDGIVSVTNADDNNIAIADATRINYTATRTSNTVVTVTMSRQTFESGNKCYFGIGALKLSDFSKAPPGSPDPSENDPDRGAKLMRQYTKEGKAYVSYSKPNGKLTVNANSDSVAFNIARFEEETYDGCTHAGFNRRQCGDCGVRARH